MRLYLPDGMLKRAADADLSDLTGCERAGDPYWDPAEPDVLVIPFDSMPTPAEQDAIALRLTSEPGVEETLHRRAWTAYADLQAFEALTSPTNPQILAVVRLLCKVARGLIRLQLRQLDKTD